MAAAIEKVKKSPERPRRKERERERGLKSNLAEAPLNLNSDRLTLREVEEGRNEARRV